DVLESGTEMFLRDAVALSSPPLHDDDDFFTEWRDPDREVVVEFVKHSYILSIRFSGNTLVAQGFSYHLCLEAIKGFLQVDERKTE
ncbi:hypothetical protein V3C99_006247, partial [Haemonchus contortus]